jgi:hypothetical protein
MEERRFKKNDISLTLLRGSLIIFVGLILWFVWTQTSGVALTMYGIFLYALLVGGAIGGAIIIETRLRSK